MGKAYADWITYKGHEIFFENHAGDKTMGNILARTARTTEIITESQKTTVLLLVDVRGIFLVKDVIDAFTTTATAIRPYAKKAAVAGITESTEVLVNFISTLSGLTIKTFESLDEAKEWLISD